MLIDTDEDARPTITKFQFVKYRPELGQPKIAKPVEPEAKPEATEEEAAAEAESERPVVVEEAIAT